MRKMKIMGACLVAVVAMGAGASAASAAGITPASTAFSATSTASKFVTSGGTVSCTSSTVSGTTPPATTPPNYGPVPINLVYSGCTAFGIAATVVPSNPCLTLAFNIGGVPANGQVSLPSSACTVTITIASIGCTLRVAGPLNINVNWTNGTGGGFSSAAIPTQTLPFTRVAGAFLCPPSGNGTLTADGTSSTVPYTVTLPATAPGVTIT